MYHHFLSEASWWLIIDQLTELSKSPNYTQQNVADELGVSKQAVSKWESGRRCSDIDNLVI